MRVEAFERGKFNDRTRYRCKTLVAQFLYGHLPQELIDTQPAVGSRETVGRQYMIGTAAIVADRLG